MSATVAIDREERHTRRRRHRIGDLIFAVAALAVTIVWFTQLRPQRLGGTTDYVMVQGISMLPTYRSGDLVLVRAADHYGVGDIVAYHVPAGDIGAGLTVIHRIVGGSPTRGFVTRGDHNEQVDDWHPKGGDIEGIPWFVLPHGGRILAFLHAPVPLGALAAALAVMVLTHRGAPPTRRPRTGRAPGSPRDRTPA